MIKINSEGNYICMRRSCASLFVGQHLVQNSEFGDTKLENRLKTKCAKEVWEKAFENMERHTMKPHVKHIYRIRGDRDEQVQSNKKW